MATNDFDPKALLDFIGSHEAPNGYDDYYRDASFAPPKPLTTMTINEVRAWQAAANPEGKGTAAAGRYQIVNYKGGETMDWLVGRLGLTGDELFDQDMQDRMGTELLRRRGLDDFVSGKITAAEFGDNVAKEWAGMPVLTGAGRGKSFYGRDGLNKALTDADSFLAAITGGRSLPFDVAEVAPSAGTISATDENIAVTAAESVAPSYVEGAGLAVGAEWVGSWAMQAAGQAEFAPDLSFKYDDELWNELTEGLPEDYVEPLFGAVSEAHARAIAANARQALETEEQLGLLGGTGVALRIGAAILDPVAIGAAILTDGAVAPAVVTAKATRLERALRHGASAGITNSALEGFIATQDPGRDASDVLTAGMLGFAVGGAAGAIIGRSEVDRKIATTAREYLNETPDGNIGAARAVGPDGQHLSAAEVQLGNAQDAPRTFNPGGIARVDMVGILKSNNHPIIRKLAGALAEDGVGNADHSVLTRSASENVTHDTKRHMTRFHRTAASQYREWLRAKGVPGWKAGLHREEFFEEVGRAVRRPKGTYTDDVAVNKVADELRAMHRELLMFAKEKGVKGFDEIPADDTYLTRIHNTQKIDEMIARFGEARVNLLVRNALIKGSDELDEEVADKIAAGYLKAIRQRRYGDVEIARVLDGEQREVLEEMLLETGLHVDEVSRISRLVAKDGETGTVRSARRRLQLDETHTEIFTDAAGTQVRLSIEDMLNNNAEELITLYTRQILGAGHLNDALRQFSIPHADGLSESVPTVDTVISHIRQTAHQHGLSKSELDEAIKKIEVLAKAVKGVPLNDQSRFGEALRLLRDYNFIRVMNQVGFAQFAEIGNILGEAGWRSTLQHVPALRSIWSRAKDGSMSDDLLDEIEVIWGIGTDRLRRTYTNRYDDYGVFEGKSVGKLDNVLQRGKAITADISLMSGVNMALQRMTARATIQRFMNMALDSGRPLSNERLASLGISPEMGQRIFQQMRENTDTASGIFGRRVKRINIDGWEDQEAASAFIHAIERWSRRVIQENDIGQMSRWMTSDIGKSMIQFRSFMVAAWQKQTLRGVHHRDFETFSAWATSMFFGGLSFVAQTYINSVGREDQQEFLDKRLNALDLGKSAFQRAAFASIVPAAADTVVYFAGYEPVFAYGRTTGLASGGITSNPTLDLADKVMRGGKGVIAPFVQDDYAFSQQDARAITGSLAFQNAMVIRNGLEALNSSLPRFSQ